MEIWSRLICQLKCFNLYFTWPLKEINDFGTNQLLQIERFSRTFCLFSEFKILIFRIRANVGKAQHITVQDSLVSTPFASLPWLQVRLFGKFRIINRHSLNPFYSMSVSFPSIGDLLNRHSFNPFYSMSDLVFHESGYGEVAFGKVQRATL